MKHIILKYNSEIKLTDEILNILKSAPKTNFQEFKELNKDDYKVSLFTDDNRMISSIKHEHENQYIYLPEPNLTTFHFNAAQILLNQLPEHKKNLIDRLKSSNQNIEDLKTQIANMILHGSAVIIYLFMTLETKLNYEIGKAPQLEFNVKWKKENQKWDKESVQRNCSITDKIKEILPQINLKCYHREHPNSYHMITELKKLRDELIHTKTIDDKFDNSHGQIIKSMLDFEYEKHLDNVKHLIDFMDQGLLEYCSCSNTTHVG